jgi:6-phosphogluconolactonase (cycloisomerase 2 family)
MPAAGDACCESAAAERKTDARRFPSRTLDALKHATIRTMPIMRTDAARFGLRAGVALFTLTAVIAQPPANVPRSVALYAGVGEELITFGLDVGRATLTRQSSLMLPGFVQEAWASSRAPVLYVAWSNGGTSYSGTGIEPGGDRHGVTAFRIDAAGALREHGAAAPLRSRPIHITGDGPGRHLLVAYNDPSGVSVHALDADGRVGEEVPQRASIDAGVYAHQVRVFPSNRAVVVVTRGHEPTASRREDPGALKVFSYDAGALSNEISIAPQNGIGYRARHLDFHPTRPWLFLSLESQNTLQVYRRSDEGLEATPLFTVSTLADGGENTQGQTTSTVHVHPNGRFVYVGNRGTPTIGRRNEIAVFRINAATGEPSLIQNADTHGFTPRTFSLDPSGRLLVVGNQNSVSVSDRGSTTVVPANLAVFRVGNDGTLTFVQRYDVAVGRKPLWWMGIVAVP